MKDFNFSHRSLGSNFCSFFQKKSSVKRTCVQSRNAVRCWTTARKTHFVKEIIRFAKEERRRVRATFWLSWPKARRVNSGVEKQNDEIDKPCFIFCIWVKISEHNFNFHMVNNVRSDSNSLLYERPVRRTSAGHYCDES